jgi:phosphoribosylaminoimidazole carboxylase
LLLNEIAPRPHNSGHHTIEACHTSQFENHLRAILSLPLGSTSLRTPSAAMINILGVDDKMAPVLAMADAALPIEGATSHLYGKAESRKSRKMGHITVTANSEAELRSRLRPILEAQPDLNEEFIDTISPIHQNGHSHAYPLVGIIMGSDSDLPVMLPATKILDKFEIPYELTITSAHRTPARMVEYAHSAVGRGLRVIIAGAGGAAHLPGMVASETAVPVIGVPVKASVLDGVDSLYSIVQMPVSCQFLVIGLELTYSAVSQSQQSESTTPPMPLY